MTRCRTEKVIGYRELPDLVINMTRVQEIHARLEDALTGYSMVEISVAVGGFFAQMGFQVMEAQRSQGEPS